MLKNLSRIVFVCAVVGWIFSGWLPVSQVYALNKTTNWNFNGNSTGWTATNGTAEGTGTGNPSCGGTTDATTNNMATFAYNGNLSGQTAFGAVSGAVKNTDYRGNINQTVVAPGSGTVKAKGKFSYYGNSSNWGTGKVGLQLWNSSNSAFVADIGCITMSSNTAWTSTSFSSVVSLTGGTTYTIRVNLVAKTKSNSNTSVTVGVDNIVVNFAPTGLVTTAPASSKSGQLDWTASTAGSGANGLHATTPYKIYRDTSSPVSTFLANATTNSYTDTSTAGNTTYFYAISDVDTASDESPLSAESSVLTRPDAPGTPSFSSVTDNSMTVSWTSPTGGAATYDVERCTGAACSSGWTTVSSAQAGLSFGDSGLSANTTYGYRIVGNNASGAGVYSTIAYQTTSSAAVYSVSITSSGLIEYGFVQIGTASSTVGNGYTQTAQNDGNTTETLNVKSSDATNGTGWTLASSIDTNIFKHEFSTTTGSRWDVMPDNATYVTAAPSVAQSGTVNFDFRLTTPSASTDYVQKSITITVQAVAP
jgi:fibronectin type 3 domain-containing protein